MALYDLVFNELLTLKIMDAICEIITLILGIICVTRLGKRYAERKAKATGYLLILFSAASLAPFAQFIDALFYTGWGSDNTFGLYDVQYGYSFILIMTSIANIGLLLFATEIFFVSNDGTISSKIKIGRIITSVLLGVLGGLGGFLKMTDQDVTLIIGAYMLFAMFLYISIGTKAYNLAKKIEDLEYKQSVRYIGHFAFALLSVYVFFVLDSFYPTYTLIGFMGWALYMISVYLGYMGFVKPIKIKSKSK